jgi:hypothetical protein
VGSKAGLEGYGEEKTACCRWGSNLDLPSHSKSLYGLLIPAPTLLCALDKLLELIMLASFFLFHAVYK